jgi:thiamine pyrophosphate-dependent acetolactate synthase large subunit-like protein
MEAMRTGGVEFVLTAHEGTAGFAADVTGRRPARPGSASRRSAPAPPISLRAWEAPFSTARP